MPCIQLLLPETDYVNRLQKLLCSEGGCQCRRVAQPDWSTTGPIVADRSAVERFPELLQHPDRLVPVTTKDPAYQAQLWEHGVRSVVFDTDPPSTVMLAILGAELRGESAKGSPPVAPNHS
jgi:hypothetical protein